MICSFVIPGEAKGKARPKSTVVNGHARVYTPGKQIEYENWVRLNFLEDNPEFASRPLFAEDKPLNVVIRIYRQMPKSFSKKKRQEMCLRPCLTKPDVDNVAKSICDALNGIAYHDDSQIYTLTVSKEWSPDTSRVMVIIAEWEH